ncbi:hypothetical protein [Thioflexithrix psekupsensis]|uniref:Uncharacterized protein n=1 Tax=Thioflexithrix psekupsensis TaxID=1570016 RepID=A0A251X9X2_9GAMM|nr:hypothetical protein [Thioflexithrix psekupsensis]OUD14473.1 hypothetical protein TPSD3_09230 [Thioflexithrix psekupsensis]
MKQRTFEQKYQADWQQLEHWLTALSHKKKQKITQQELEQFAYLYRQVCQHLALAQSRHYSSYLIDRLNHLVLAGHQLLYTRRSRFFYTKIKSFIKFFCQNQNLQNFRIFRIKE